MSTDQPTLFEFETRERTREERWLAAHVGGDTNQQCHNCNSHVSARFAATNSDNDGIVHACPSCANAAELGNGAAAKPDYEHRNQVFAGVAMRRSQR